MSAIIDTIKGIQSLPSTDGREKYAYPLFPDAWTFEHFLHLAQTAPLRAIEFFSPERLPVGILNKAIFTASNIKLLTETLYPEGSRRTTTAQRNANTFFEHLWGFLFPEDGADSFDAAKHNKLKPTDTSDADYIASLFDENMATKAKSLMDTDDDEPTLFTDQWLRHIEEGEVSELLELPLSEPQKAKCLTAPVVRSDDYEPKLVFKGHLDTFRQSQDPNAFFLAMSVSVRHYFNWTVSSALKNRLSQVMEVGLPKVPELSFEQLGKLAAIHVDLLTESRFIKKTAVKQTEYIKTKLSALARLVFILELLKNDKPLPSIINADFITQLVADIIKECSTSTQKTKIASTLCLKIMQHTARRHHDLNGSQEILCRLLLRRLVDQTPQAKLLILLTRVAYEHVQALPTLFQALLKTAFDREKEFQADISELSATAAAATICQATMAEPSPKQQLYLLAHFASGQGPIPDGWLDADDYSDLDAALVAILNGADDAKSDEVLDIWGEIYSGPSNRLFMLLEKLSGLAQHDKVREYLERNLPETDKTVTLLPKPIAVYTTPLTLPIELTTLTPVYDAKHESTTFLDATRGFHIGDSKFEGRFDAESQGRFNTRLLSFTNGDLTAARFLTLNLGYDYLGNPGFFSVIEAVQACGYQLKTNSAHTYNHISRGTEPSTFKFESSVAFSDIVQVGVDDTTLSDESVFSVSSTFTITKDDGTGEYQAGEPECQIHIHDIGKFHEWFGKEPLRPIEPSPDAGAGLPPALFEDITRDPVYQWRLHVHDAVSAPSDITTLMAFWQRPEAYQIQRAGSDAAATTPALVG